MMHEIPADTLNSNIEYCIDEYVRNETHREMLRDKWFRGKSLDQIAAKYEISLTTTKKIIYEIGDPILIRASIVKPKKEHLFILLLAKLEKALTGKQLNTITRAAR